MNRPPEHAQRRLIRLRAYDYSLPGACFVTICSHERKPVFSDAGDDGVVLNSFGRIVRDEWYRTGLLRPYVRLDAFVVMPNHVHGIIWIVDDGVGARRRRAPTDHDIHPNEQFGKPVPGSLSTIVRAFKSAVTRRISERRNTPGAPVWQRGYYEHVVRNEEDLARIRQYIQDNLGRWEEDPENPAAKGIRTS